MDVVDHELDVARGAHEPDDECDREPDPAEDGEADRAIPLRGPEHVLQHVEGEEVERTDEPTDDADDHDQAEHARLDVEDSGVENVPKPRWS